MDFAHPHKFQTRRLCAGPWSLVAVHWTLVGHLSLCTGPWSLVAVRWTLVTCR